MRLGTVHPASGQQQIHRHMIGDAFWQFDGGGIGQRASANFWQGKTCALSGKDQIAGQRNFKTTTNAHALHCGNHRLVQIAQLLQAAKAANAIIGGNGITIGCGLQIPPGRKEFFPGGAQDTDAQFIIVTEMPEGLPHLARGCQINGVGFRPVECNLENTAILPGFDYIIHCHIHS